MIRIKYLIIVVILALFTSGCNNLKTEDIVDPYKEYGKSNFNNYSEIYNILNDTINQWIVDSLSCAIGYRFGNIQVDSVMIFNSKKDLLYTTINKSSKMHLDGRTDIIEQVQGIKINGKWYFYTAGGVLALPREFYKEDIYEPLTYEELSFLAHRELYPNFFFDKADGSYKPNDAWFDKKFYTHNTREKLEPIIIQLSKDRSQRKIDQEEFAKIVAKIKSSKRPPIPKRELTFTEKIFGKKKKLFDSEAWKNRHKD